MLSAWWVVLTAGPVVAATADPVTDPTQVIVKQGPWAAATVLVFLAMSWLAKKVIERGWTDQATAIKRLEEDRDRWIARAAAAEARNEELEKDVRERFVPLLTDLYRVLPTMIDVIRDSSRRRDST